LIYRLWCVNRGRCIYRLWRRRIDRLWIEHRRIASKEVGIALTTAFDKVIPKKTTIVFVVRIYWGVSKKRSIHLSLHRVLDCEMRHPYAQLYLN
jgi:hypothetical protein